MRILVFSSTRADAGILKPLVDELGSREEFDCTVLLTGSHARETSGKVLQSELGRISGVAVDVLEYLKPSSSGQSARHDEHGLALTKFLHYFEDSRPQLVILLGDRTEALLAAIAANLNGVPIAHIHGGEVTLGALDELHRHAISKLSQVHFPADEEAASRLQALGERPESIYMVGSLRDDYLRTFIPMNRAGLATKFGIPEQGPLVSVAIHPSMFDEPSTYFHLEAFLSACDDIPGTLVFTGVNVDKGSEALRARIMKFVMDNPNRSVFCESMGSDGFLSLLSHSQVACGNSSSLVLEAPKLGTRTVILGRRQEGRAPKSECLPADSAEIRVALLEALRQRSEKAPLSQFNVSAGIASAILAHDFSISTKEFFDYRTGN